MYDPPRDGLCVYYAITEHIRPSKRQKDRERRARMAQREVMQAVKEMANEERNMKKFF